MKLSELTSTTLSEGLIDPNALMALQSIITNGKFSNKFEEIVLAKFGMLVKQGTFWQVEDPLFGKFNELDLPFLNMLRSLPEEELRNFATYIYKVAQAKNTSMDCCSSMSTLDWMNLYTAREATD